MKYRRRLLQLCFYASLMTVVALVVYKIYLNFFEMDFAAVHARQIERIETRFEGSRPLHIGVAGNIQNSVGVFERRMIPLINQSNIDFFIANGNAVSSGGEDKYRALFRTLSHLQMPYLLTFGVKENSRLGDFRFYDHFGPYVYRVDAGNAMLLFLDSTGKTSFRWQLRWLERQLQQRTQPHALLFLHHPLLPIARGWPLNIDSDDMASSELSTSLLALLERFPVDAVFSAGAAVYDRQVRKGIQFIVSGGGGGFVPDSDQGFYHFLEITTTGNQVTITPHRLYDAQHHIWRTLESFWFFIHSLFYVGYLNFVLLVCIMVAIAIVLYSKIFLERDYYAQVVVDLTRWQQRSLRITHFTNNFLPFIGGVPISIDRLRQGLRAQGHTLQIVAPCYGKAANAKVDHVDEIIRVPPLLPVGGSGQFRMVNLFSWHWWLRVKRFRPDVIHVHHPFWLGRAGLLLGRWFFRVPVIFTYHTRLEHYGHYVPLPGPLFRNLIAHVMVRQFANQCDGVIVPTVSVEHYLRLIGVRAPVYIQPTGVAAEAFRTVPATTQDALRTRWQIGDAMVLLCIARLGKEKNVDFIIDAMVRLQRIRRQQQDSPQPRPVRLLIVGEGPERSRLQQRLETEGLSACVTLVGAVPPEEIPVYCGISDIFVFASCSETQGMVILEAMAAGLPVVSVRSSGVDDLVVDGLNGFKTNLDLEAWVARLTELMAQPQLRRRMGAQARRFAERYSLEAVAQATSQIYIRALAQSEASGRASGDHAAGN